MDSFIIFFDTWIILFLYSFSKTFFFLVGGAGGRAGGEVVSFEQLSRKILSCISYSLLKYLVYFSHFEGRFHHHRNSFFRLEETIKRHSGNFFNHKSLWVCCNMMYLEFFFFSYQQSFDRPNLQYLVAPKSKKTLMDIVNKIKTSFKNESGILYCLSRYFFFIFCIFVS